MKTILFKNRLLTIILLSGAFFFLKSDIIPENSHSVTRTVVITNCNEFPDIEFIGYIDNIMGDNSFYQVSNNSSLHKGYKFNRLFIFGVEQNKLRKLGGIEKLSDDYVLARINPGEILSSATLWVDNSSMLESEEIFYEMEKITEDVFVAKLKKRISNFLDKTQLIDEY